MALNLTKGYKMQPEVMDYLLAQKNLAVVFLNDHEYKNEWVWTEILPDGSTLYVHGEDIDNRQHRGYNREEAYEDAFRYALGLESIADEGRIKN